MLVFAQPVIYFIHATCVVALFKFFKQQEKPYGNSLLSRKEVESANKAVVKHCNPPQNVQFEESIIVIATGIFFGE